MNGLVVGVGLDTEAEIELKCDETDGRGEHEFGEEKSPWPQTDRVDENPEHEQIYIRPTSPENALPQKKKYN